MKKEGTMYRAPARVREIYLEKLATASASVL
jgi:hypothetical protein